MANSVCHVLWHLICIYSVCKGLSVPILRVITVCFIEICVFNADSADPDQMPQNVASEFVLHCLPIILLWGSLTKMA